MATESPHLSPTLRILHLEDHPPDDSLVQASLRQATIRAVFTSVATADAFVGALMRDRSDLSLAEYRLPGYDGLTASEPARELQLSDHFPFVTGSIGAIRAINRTNDGAGTPESTSHSPH